jgi:hypothetical protein
MSEPKAEVVQLHPMRVAAHHYMGRFREERAIQTLVEWAAVRGLLRRDPPPRFFGFNHPEPKAKGDPDYGYEFWVTVGEEVEAEGKIAIKEEAGGTYLVVEGLDVGWKWVHAEFDAWAEKNGYEYDDSRRWLEEHIPRTGSLDRFADLPGEERWETINVLLPIRARTTERDAPIQ